MAISKNADKTYPSVTKSTEKGYEREVDFSFSAPKATRVFLAGKFNAWNTSSLPMKKGKDGVWRIKVKLAQGQHEYKYFVDGTWAQETACAGLDKVINAYGTYNCIVSVR
ncbi:MAG TPA: isoamylase early set domain-containing protein [Nitrospirota bacterium]|nr:isoamylase early set domain-containing protein [Nitrospirota bacterium]